MSRVAVITGGAGGLGRALCTRLVSDGWQVLLIDRPGPELSLLDDADGRVETHACDLTVETQTADVCQAILDRHPAIDLVVYNAGITQIAPFAEADIAAHRKVMEVNYFGAMHVAHHLLGAVRKASGVHLAITSVAGFSPLAKRTAYAASKHAMHGFFTSLRSEEKPHGVAVLIAAPSFVATNPGNPGTDRGGIARPGSATDALDTMGADEAARIILEGARRLKPFIPVGRVARLAWFINRLSPRLYQRIMERNIGAGE